MPPTLRALVLLFGLLAFAAPCRAQDALQRVRSRGELTIATDPTYLPFETKEGNNPVEGFDVDIATEVGKELGVRIKWMPMEWSGVFSALATGKCDLVMSGVTITDERKKGNAFTRPYFLSGQAIARRKGDTSVGGPDDLVRGEKIIAVQQETTGQFAAVKRGVPMSRIHRFDTLQDGLLDVRNRKADAVVGDLPALKDFLRKSYAELEIAPGGMFVSENLGVVARPADPELIAALNIALERIMADGRYARIYQKWIGDPVTLPLLGKLDSVRGAGTVISPAASKAALAALGKPGGSATDAVAGTSAVPTSAFALRPEQALAALPLLLSGAWLTIKLTLLTLVFGVPLGLLLALARLSRFPPLRAAATVYVEAVRGTPLLMQIYVLYFVLPALGPSLPAFAAGLAALSLNSAAYVAEIFRAGIESIDIGQREAALALGMTGGQTMRYVVLPQTLRRVLPPLTNEAVALLKDSSLVSVIALTELMRVGKEISTNSGSPTTIYLTVALLYLAMTLPLTGLVRRLEAHWQPTRRVRKGVTV